MLKITKEIKKDFKQANQISFSSNSNYNLLRIHTKEGYSKEITLENRNYYDYKDCWFNDYTDCSGWQALYHIIKSGDEVLFFVGENNSENLTKAGLFNDQLTCKVMRNNKTIIYQLLLSYSICANNSARAIKVV